MSDDILLNARQIARLLGYDIEHNPTAYKAVYARLERAGIQPWRDPSNPKGRTVRYWQSDIHRFMREGAAPAQHRAEQPASGARPWDRAAS